MSNKKWTPDQKLGADATKDQIDDRHSYLCQHPGPSPDYFPMWEVCGEFAKACVVAERLNRISDGMMCVRCGAELRASDASVTKNLSRPT